MLDTLSNYISLTFFFQIFWHIAPPIHLFLFFLFLLYNYSLLLTFQLGDSSIKFIHTIQNVNSFLSLSHKTKNINEDHFASRELHELLLVQFQWLQDRGFFQLATLGWCRVTPVGFSQDVVTHEELHRREKKSNIKMHQGLVISKRIVVVWRIWGRAAHACRIYKITGISFEYVAVPFVRLWLNTARCIC